MMVMRAYDYCRIDGKTSCEQREDLIERYRGGGVGACRARVVGGSRGSRTARCGVLAVRAGDPVVLGR